MEKKPFEARQTVSCEVQEIASPFFPYLIIHWPISDQVCVLESLLYAVPLFTKKGIQVGFPCFCFWRSLAHTALQNNSITRLFISYYTAQSCITKQYFMFLCATHVNIYM